MSKFNKTTNCIIRDPEEAILTRHHWLTLFSYGFLITVSVLTAFMLSFLVYEMGETRSVTVAFLTLAFSQLFHVFNMREAGSSLFKNDIVKNLYVWGAILLCILLLLAAIYIPPLASLLKITSPGVKGWTIIIIFSLVPLVVGQTLKIVFPATKED